MAAEGKPAVKSSQNIMNVVVPLLAVFIPGVKEFVANNPEVVLGLISVLNIVWRTFITKKPITSAL